MDDHNRQPERESRSAQWHTLSDNLLDMDSEKTQRSVEATVETPSHSRNRTQSEEPISNQSIPQESLGSAERDEYPGMAPTKKKKMQRWPIAVAVVALLLIGSVILAYFTVHRWTEPTCTEASVCTICGKTGSPAAGHSWTPTSCTAPKTCRVCHETEGTPLGHDLMDETFYDFIECTKESWRACSRCEYRTSSESEQLTSLLDDTGVYFRMSANEFKERLEYLASQFEPEESLLYGDHEDNPYHNMKNVTFRWAENDSDKPEDLSDTAFTILECYAGSELVAGLAVSNFNADGVDEMDKDSPSSFNAVLMIIASNSQTAKSVYNSMEIITVAACDPEISVYSMSAAVCAICAYSDARREYHGLIYGFSDSAYSITTLKTVEKVANS